MPNPYINLQTEAVLLSETEHPDRTTLVFQGSCEDIFQALAHAQTGYMIQSVEKNGVSVPLESATEAALEGTGDVHFAIRMRENPLPKLSILLDSESTGTGVCRPAFGTYPLTLGQSISIEIEAHLLNRIDKVFVNGMETTYNPIVVEDVQGIKGSILLSNLQTNTEVKIRFRPVQKHFDWDFSNLACKPLDENGNVKALKDLVKGYEALQPSPLYRATDVGNAVRFNGVNNVYTALIPTELSLTRDNTVTFFVGKFNEYKQSSNILEHENATTPKFYIGIYSTYGNRSYGYSAGWNMAGLVGQYDPDPTKYEILTLPFVATHAKLYEEPKKGKQRFGFFYNKRGGYYITPHRHLTVQLHENQRLDGLITFGRTKSTGKYTSCDINQYTAYELLTSTEQKFVFDALIQKFNLNA